MFWDVLGYHYLIVINTTRFFMLTKLEIKLGLILVI